jgi:hypothetical protein
VKFFLTGLGNLYDNINPIIKGVIEADKQGIDGALMPDHYMWGEAFQHFRNLDYINLSRK